MKMKQKSQSKLVIAMSAVILLLVALSATLTFAYFTSANEGNSSSVSFGNLKLSANTLAVSSTDCHTPIVPGCKISLGGKLSMDESTNIKSYVRLNFNVEVGTIAGGNFTADIDQSQFTDTIKEFVGSLAGALGDTWVTVEEASARTSGTWFYLNKKTNGTANEDIIDFSTAKTFKMPLTLGNDWQGKTIQIKITAQAIQADHLVDSTSNEVTVADGAVDFATKISSVAAWNVSMETGK